MKTQLEYIYGHEANRANDVWLTQPIGQGKVRDYTFAQAMDEVRRVASYLRGLNLPASSHIAIFAKNNAWWFLTDLAIAMAGHVSVPIYPTLNAASIRQILEHSGAKLIFVGKLDGYTEMAPGIPMALPRISLPLAPAMEATRWEEIISKTAPLEGTPNRGLDELATIIYTSGSTGIPKGVMHTFRTIAATEVFNAFAGTRDDRLISYLPLAHVAERAMLESCTIRVGSHIFFAESLETFVDDVKRARPTIFGSVPRLWLKFQSGVFAKMPAKKLDLLLKIPILRGVIRRKVLAGLGLDQVRMAVTGSAPTPPELVRWYASLGLELFEIYGMTENFAVSHAAYLGEIRQGYVGPPQPGVEQKISEAGEVLMKSPGLMTGYFKAEELTAEAIDKDGFFHTGDRGEIDANGRLKITGRVKELFKTSKGKYVAPAPIENSLLACPDIEQACVSGASMPQPFAMVVLAEHVRKRIAEGHEREAVAKIIFDHVGATNRGLDPHEQLEKIVVMTDEWTVENGMLTPTLKLKRAAIEGRYAESVAGWYQAPGKVLWA